MSSASNGSGAVPPGSPVQPTQAPSRPFMTGSIAVTRPPGLGRHSTCPSGGPVTLSTGRRLATTTRSWVWPEPAAGAFGVLVEAMVRAYPGWPDPSR